MLKWEKLGKIFDPTEIKNRDWLNDFAQCTSTLVCDDYVRVYFSCRPPVDKDGQFVSYTSYLDLDRTNLKKIIKVADEPILQLGELGTFDEFGIYPSSILKQSNNIYFYYAGWTRMASVFANVAIGVAISNDGGTTFDRIGKGPILSRTVNEPFQVSGPKVRIYDDKFYMFYISGEEWLISKQGKTETIYKIKMATSDDGINWNRNGKAMLGDILGAQECQAGPDVFYHLGKYHMYFSYRYGLDFRGNDRGYRIGYAYSEDLENWTRDDDNIGIKLSDEGWDSKDMHYPHVFELDGNHYMLYNGNNFGRYGFGIAILEN